MLNVHEIYTLTARRHSEYWLPDPTQPEGPSRETKTLLSKRRRNKLNIPKKEEQVVNSNQQKKKARRK